MTAPRMPIRATSPDDSNALAWYAILTVRPRHPRILSFCTACPSRSARQDRAAARYFIVPVTKRPALGPPIPRAPLSLKVTNEILVGVAAYAVRAPFALCQSPRHPWILGFLHGSSVTKRQTRPCRRKIFHSTGHEAPSTGPPIPRASLSLRVTNEVLASSVRFAIATTRLCQVALGYG